MNAWISDLNLVGTSWFDAIVRATWQGGIALALVWIVSRGIAPMPARYKSWLWRLAFLKLLLALVWITPISLALLPAKTISIPSTRPVVEDISPSGVDSLAFAGLAPVREPRAIIGWRTWLLMAWVIGLGLGAARIGIQWHSVYRLRRASLPLPDPTSQESLARLARAFRLRRIPALRQTETAASPLLVGIFRPAIILPSHILRNCSEAQLEMMLAHELAHLRRRDLWWLWFFALCEMLFFFHPFVWLVRREWNLAAESACDELAVRVTRGAPSEYSAKLIDIVAQISAQPPPAQGFAVGMSESATTLKRRLKAMTAKKNPIAIVAAIALMIVGALTLVPCRLVAQAADEETLARLKEENAKLKQELDTTRQEIETLRQQAMSARQQDEAEAQRAVAEAQRDAARRIELAQRELDELLKRYTGSHPKVTAKTLELEKLQQALQQLIREHPHAHSDLLSSPDRKRREAFVPARGQRSATREERELLVEEIKLAERQVQSVHKRLENGKGTFDELLGVQRELLDLKLQLAEFEGSKAEQRAVLLQQLKVAEQLLKEQRKRVEVGTLDPDGAISSEREVLRIKRALATLE